MSLVCVCRLLTLWLATCVFALPLNAVQYAALMNVYNGLGCNANCPRFSASSNCTPPATCVGGKVTQLSFFNFRFTGSLSLSSNIEQLTALITLDLAYNQLTAIPSTIGQLTALEYLNLNSNLLTMIPSTIGQLTALTYLGLSVNQLTAIPSTIDQLTALKTLTLNNNQLTAIPSTIGQLTALTVLLLHNNQLTALPSATGQLTNLAKCNLQDAGSDTNCLDCSTNPNPRCQCVVRTCSSPAPTSATPTSTQPTTPSTPATTTAASSLTATTTTALASSSTGSSPTSSTFTAAAITAISNTNTTTTVMPATATPFPNDNVALIGGIVGGIVALIVVVALIACIVARSRRHRPNNQHRQQSNSNDVATAAPESSYGQLPHLSNPTGYGDLELKPSDNYNDPGVLVSLDRSQYGSPDRTNYSNWDE